MAGGRGGAGVRTVGGGEVTTKARLLQREQGWGNSNDVAGVECRLAGMKTVCTWQRGTCW